MKILIFDTWLAPFHVATALEIAETHINDRDDVQYVNIASELPFIEVHHPHKFSQLWVIKKKYKNLALMCKKVGVPYSFQSGVSRNFSFKLPETIQTIDDLKHWDYEGMDLGMSILSSLITLTNDIEPDLLQYDAYVNKITTSCIKTLMSLKYWCEKVKPDRIYFVNGRTAVTRPILRYCEKMGIDYRTHERGGNENGSSYSVHTTFLHDHASYNELIENHWKQSKHTEQERISIANDFFERLRSGKKEWDAFNSWMDKNRLPENFNPTSYNIAFFSSSITEFAAIDLNKNAEKLFPNQFESVRFCANILSELPNARFYIRLHPNTKLSFPKEYQRWLDFVEEMKGKVIWIDGDSGVDTYALMRSCQKIIVSYSTVGIEAPIYDIPVIATMIARYSNLGSTYFADNKDILKEWLLNVNLPPLPKIGSYKFAYFQMTWGIPFKHYVQTNRYSGSFFGINLDDVTYNWFDKLVMKFMDRYKISSL